MPGASTGPPRCRRSAPRKGSVRAFATLAAPLSRACTRTLPAGMAESNAIVGPGRGTQLVAESFGSRMFE
eukprot:9205727-Alexandrium_andersonii.AAC.1